MNLFIVADAYNSYGHRLAHYEHPYDTAFEAGFLPRHMQEWYTRYGCGIEIKVRVVHEDELI